MWSWVGNDTNSPPLDGNNGSAEPSRDFEALVTTQIKFSKNCAAQSDDRFVAATAVPGEWKRGDTAEQRQ